MAMWEKCGCATQGNMDEMSGALYTSDCAEGLNKQLYANDIIQIQVFWDVTPCHSEVVPDLS
jgi:hypothetical protein